MTHELEFTFMSRQQDKFTNLNFSTRFRELMDTSGKTQKELAAALGLSEGALINYKRDSTPKSHELLAIAQYFGVSMEWLLTGNQMDTERGDASWRQRAIAAEQRLTAVKAGLSAMLKKI
jgi:transcriptional regulator with XRE-family HTH domain